MAKVEKFQFKGDDGKWVDIGWTVGDEFVLSKKSPFEVQAFPNVFVETTMTQAVPLSDVYIYGDEDFPDEAWLRHRGAEFPVLVDFLNSNPYGTPSILVTMTSETEHRWRIHLAKNGLGVFPKPKFVSAVVPSAPPSTVSSSHERRANELVRRIPGLQQRHASPCGCSGTEHYAVMDAIIHLNDAHHPRLNKASHREGWEPWTREMIADWLETLPFDFTVQDERVRLPIDTWPTPNVYFDGAISGDYTWAGLLAMSTTGSEKLKDINTWPTPATTPVFAALQGKIDQAVKDMLIPDMSIHPSFTTNKEEDK